MLTLLQVINRMIYLEYTRAEVESHLDALASGELSSTDLFDILGLMPPSPAMLSRFIDVLPKRESAISISFLRAEPE